MRPGLGFDAVAKQAVRAIGYDEKKIGNLKTFWTAGVSKQLRGRRRRVVGSDSHEAGRSSDVACLFEPSMVADWAARLGWEAGLGASPLAGGFQSSRSIHWLLVTFLPRPNLDC